MSYDIHLKGGDVINVNTERGKKIWDMWFNGQDKAKVDIDGNGYLIGDIKRMEQAPDPKHFDYSPPETQIEAGRICQGKYSIQKEINNIIRSEGEGWPKKIQDTKYRNKIREQLRATPGVMWCDYKANGCAC